MESQVAVPRKLWEHPDPKSTLMYEFMQDISRKSGQRLEVRNVAPIHYPCSMICRYDLRESETDLMG